MSPSFINKSLSFYFSVSQLVGIYKVVKFDFEDSETRNSLKNKITALAQNIPNLRKDIKAFEYNRSDLCWACGTNAYSQDATVIVADNFDEVDENAFNFVVKHEFSHILNNDLFYGPSLSLAAMIAYTYFSFSSTSRVWSAGTYLVSLTSTIAYSYFSEKTADAFAIKNSSIEELKGGRRFFKAILLFNKEEKFNKSFLEKILHDSNGENRYDLLHPSYASRISEIEKELAMRGKLEIDEEVENKKILELKKFITKLDKIRSLSVVV